MHNHSKLRKKKSITCSEIYRKIKKKTLVPNLTLMRYCSCSLFKCIKYGQKFKRRKTFERTRIFKEILNIRIPLKRIGQKSFILIK